MKTQVETNDETVYMRDLHEANSEYETTLLGLAFAAATDDQLARSDVSLQELADRVGNDSEGRPRDGEWVRLLLTGALTPQLEDLADVALSLGFRWKVSLEPIGTYESPPPPGP